MAWLAASLLWLGLVPGCNIRQVHVVVPDFDPKSVQGIDVYQMDASGNPVLALTMQFDGVGLEWGGVEALSYSVVTPGGNVTSNLLTPVIRRSSSGSAEFKLFFDSAISPGYVRVSSFNAAGSSPLSTDQVYVM